MSWDKQIKSRLSELRRRMLGLKILSGAWRCGGGVLVILLIAGLLETALFLNPGIRTLLFSGLLSGGFVFISLWILFPLLKHWTKPASHKKLALLWGRSLSGINDRLLNALQVFENRDSDKTSPELAELALTAVADELKDASFEKALDRADVIRSRKWTIRAVGVWLVLMLITQGSLIDAMGRIFQPGVDFRPPPPFSLALRDVPALIVRGEPLNVAISGKGLLPEAVNVSFIEEGSDPLNLLAEFDSSGAARASYDNPQNDLKVFAYSEEIFSDTALVEVKARPFIKELQVRWFPPAYSKLPTGSSIGKRGDVAALKGSRVRLSFTADREIETAQLVIFNDANPYQPCKLTMEINECEASEEFTLLKSGHYNIIFEDRDGILNAEPVDYNLWPIRDEYPAISFFYPPPDAELNESLLAPIKAGARDDFAISKVRLGRYLAKGGIEDSTDKIQFDWQDITFESFDDGTSLIDLLFDLNDMNLLPGDHILYKLQAWDNDRISGPKKAETPVQRLRFPTLEEIFTRMEEGYSDQVEDISETLERSRMLKEDLEALREELKRNPDLSWEEKKNVEEMLKHQQEMAEQASQMAQKIEEMISKLEENSLLSPETLEKYTELQQMLSEIMTPELMEAMQRLQDALKQQDPEQLRRAVEEFSINQEEFLDKMEKTLNILKQLQMEMKLDELAKRAEELLKKQKAINEALDDSSGESGSRPEEAQAEKDLQEEMEAFEKEFAEVQEMLKEYQHNPEDEMKAAQQLLDEEQFPEQMGSMSESLEQGDDQSAKQQGEKLQNSLAKLSEMMKRAKEQMINSAKSDLAEALKKISHDLLSLSFQQEDLLDKSNSLNKASSRFRSLAQEQQTLKNHLEKTAEDLFDLSQKSFFITPKIGGAIEQAFGGMDQALSGYTARTPRSVSRQQQNAMGGLNSAVMEIGESLDQMSSSSSSTGFAEMMEQLSNMSGMQSQINQGTMTLLPGGTNPGQMTMEQQAAMSRLAAEQEALRQQMENWSQSNQELSGMLGRLGELSKEMQEVVNDLKNRQVDQRTLKRQERILRRLLDAQKSVREREFRRERLSRTAEAPLFNPSPDELELSLTPDEVRERLLRALREGYTRDYQQLIRNYFDALSREN